jgi:hypothetical protein
MNTATLDLLDRIGESHRRMADLADELDWDSVVKEWQSIYPEIVELKRLSLDRLKGRERVRAARQITEMLEFEERISARIIPWMDQVQPLLKTFRQHPLKNEEGA